tara:strand:- start:5884 stop:6435 length:552 start_codon:yes stop_codon:yes gene_type:complete
MTESRAGRYVRNTAGTIAIAAGLTTMISGGMYFRGRQVEIADSFNSVASTAREISLAGKTPDIADLVLLQGKVRDLAERAQDNIASEPITSNLYSTASIIYSKGVGMDPTTEQGEEDMRHLFDSVRVEVKAAGKGMSNAYGWAGAGTVTLGAILAVLGITYLTKRFITRDANRIDGAAVEGSV